MKKKQISIEWFQCPVYFIQLEFIVYLTFKNFGKSIDIRTPKSH